MKAETAFQHIKLIEDHCPELYIHITTPEDIAQHMGKRPTKAQVLGAMSYLRSRYDCNLTYWENIENAIGD